MEMGAVSEWKKKIIDVGVPLHPSVRVSKKNTLINSLSFWKKMTSVRQRGEFGENSCKRTRVDHLYTWNISSD